MNMSKYEKMSTDELEDICVSEMGYDYVDEWCADYDDYRQGLLDLIHDNIA